MTSQKKLIGIIPSNCHLMRAQVTIRGDIFMIKKVQTFHMYTEEFKLNAVRSYVEGSSSYK